MEKQNLPDQGPDKSRKVSTVLVWVASVTVFCLIFAFAFVPKALAQGRTQQDSSQYIQTIRSVFDFIQRNYVEEIDSQALFEGAMTGMFNSLEDPYSNFLSESQMAGLSHTTQGNFGGVGLFVSKPLPQSDGRPSFLEVASPIENTPGWQAGINPGDQIISIDGEPTDVLSSDDAVARLRGPAGTPVDLIIRRGDRIEFPVTLVRAVIEVPTVRHAMIGDIGYLRLLTFTPMTAARSRDAVNEFKNSNYSGIILDLRNNYGGLLNAAVDVSNIFFEGSLVVSTRSRIQTENNNFYARSRSLVSDDIPIVVLINRGSASASEIVAGALKDQGRALLVGETSFGKGSVQQVFPLNNVGFTITTARYFTPSGANIDRLGIPPDREVRMPDFSDADAEQLNALINSGRIADFVRENPEARTAEAEALVQALQRDYGLDIDLLRRLVRNEQNRRNLAPVFDLEYDVQLKEAVRILREDNLPALIRATRSIQAMQEEALKADISLPS